jgi:hypothetical protein
VAEAKKITFRLNGSKHTLTADTQAVRDGWFKAFEENIAKAKELKETIVSNPSFKETYEKLSTSSIPHILKSLTSPSQAGPCRSGRVCPQEEHRLQV